MPAAPVIVAEGGDEMVENKLAGINLEGGSLKPVNIPSTQSSSVAASLREKPAGPIKTPIVDPIESTQLTPIPELTAEQQAKYETVLETVKSWKEVPSTTGKGGPITESEIMWLTRECLLRYLRATKWSTTEAVKRLLGTLTWRREYGVWELTGDDVSPENETGKQIILGFDNASRPCHYLNPGRQNTEPSPRQVQHLVFMVERVIDLMIPGQETLALLINFKASKSRTNTAPGIGQGREVLNILQTHYPERLGRAYVINIPWIVWGFLKLIMPFIDPLTKEKLKFNEPMREHVPIQQLWTEFQGELEFEYEHELYWPALLKLCEERHAEQMERWVKAGKCYGESELYLKGGNAQSVGQGVVVEAPVEAAALLEKGKGIDPIESAPESSESKATVQLNGNMEAIAEKEDPVPTTAGDRA